jgi:hypothetical protein
MVIGWIVCQKFCTTFQPFLSKAGVPLQKQSLRSGWTTQNLLSWAALALSKASCLYARGLRIQNLLSGVV